MGRERVEKAGEEGGGGIDGWAMPPCCLHTPHPHPHPMAGSSCAGPFPALPGAEPAPRSPSGSTKDLTFLQTFHGGRASIRSVLLP